MTLFIRALRTITLSFVALVALPVVAHTALEPHPVMSQFNQLESEVREAEASIGVLQQESRQGDERLDSRITSLPPRIAEQELTQLISTIIGSSESDEITTAEVVTAIAGGVGGAALALTIWWGIRAKGWPKILRKRLPTTNGANRPVPADHPQTGQAEKAKDSDRDEKPDDSPPTPIDDGERKTMFKDLEARKKFGPFGKLSYVIRAQKNGKFKFRIRALNNELLAESDTEYATVKDAEDMLAVIHDNAVKGNVELVHKPVDDEEDDRN